MKMKQVVTFLFLFSFSVYNLCPVLIQGNCGVLVVNSTPVGAISLSFPAKTAKDSTPRCEGPGTCASCCKTGASNTSPREKPQVGNCCFLGLELVRPDESDDLSQYRGMPLSSSVVIPSPSTLPLADETAFCPHLFVDLYDYFAVYQISPRAPPHLSIQHFYV